jgi:hypothetical protein
MTSTPATTSELDQLDQLGRYGASTDPAEIVEGLQIVEKSSGPVWTPAATPCPWMRAMTSWCSPFTGDRIPVAGKTAADRLLAGGHPHHPQSRRAHQGAAARAGRPPWPIHGRGSAHDPANSDRIQPG